MQNYESSYSSSTSFASNLTDQSSDLSTVKGLTSSLEICSHQKVGKHRYDFKEFNTNKMSTRWITTDKLEQNANGILQDYIKEYNLIFKKVSLHDQLCRKKMPNCSTRKKVKSCVMKWKHLLEK